MDDEEREVAWLAMPEKAPVMLRRLVTWGQRLRRPRVLVPSLLTLALLGWGTYFAARQGWASYHYRAAQQAIIEHGPVTELTILATTYHEKPWITEAVFNSIYREMATLEGLVRQPRLIVVTG